MLNFAKVYNFSKDKRLMRKPLWTNREMTLNYECIVQSIKGIIKEKS